MDTFKKLLAFANSVGEDVFWLFAKIALVALLAAACWFAWRFALTWSFA